tara:strand:- start:1771 stop:2487 length:717 start_codon:yes stop_codon:yes gene_type:complete
MGKLSGQATEVRNLTKLQVSQMYSLMDQYYSRVRKKSFLADLNEKDHALLMLDSFGMVRGFSTQQIISSRVGDITTKCLFSGDTIIDRAYWGEQVLSSLWGKYAYNLYESLNEGEEAYWFLMSKGYRTYRFLPTFFNKFFPTYREETPEKEKAVLDHFASIKYPNNYVHGRGIVSFNGEKDSLRECICDVPEKVLTKPDVRYFLEANPGWIQGDELCCIAEISDKNFNRMAKRLILRN